MGTAGVFAENCVEAGPREMGLLEMRWEKGADEGQDAAWVGRKGQTFAECPLTLGQMLYMC